MDTCRRMTRIHRRPHTYLPGVQLCVLGKHTKPIHTLISAILSMFIVVSVSYLDAWIESNLSIRAPLQEYAKLLRGGVSCAHEQQPTLVRVFVPATGEIRLFEAMQAVVSKLALKDKQNCR